MSDVLKQFIEEVIVEKRMREVDVSDGSKVPHGSSKHVNDLKVRIADLERWRARQKRGTEARANYSRLISRLKGELSSAIKVAKKAAKKKPKTKVVQETLTREEAQEYKMLSRELKRSLQVPASSFYATRGAENAEHERLSSKMNDLMKKAGARNVSDMDNIVNTLVST